MGQRPDIPRQRSLHSLPSRQRTACSSIGLVTARQQTWPNGNGTRVNYWTREVEKQNTRYRDRSIEKFVSFERSFEIVHFESNVMKPKLPLGLKEP